MHTCSIENGSLGSPILDLKNNKVIGINKGGESNSKNFNNGTFLKCLLKLFFKKYEYQIIKELGKGQFGKVNKVLSKSDNKYYALKEISIKGESQEKINNIKKEAEILSKFNCNNIVKYYDSFEDNGKFYILMEYCKGQNLKSFINEFKMKDELIEENILFHIIKQICLGIKEIHSKKIIHRDLKPDNIFVDDKMNVKIGDFGISKQLSYNKAYTITKNKGGSLFYIAPEILDDGIYNEKSDIWSFGCIVYELFNLRNYFLDKQKNDIKKLRNELYNFNWQKLIDLLLKIDDNKRIDINQVYILLKEFNENNLKNNDFIKQYYDDSNNKNSTIYKEEKISIKLPKLSTSNAINKIINYEFLGPLKPYFLEEIFSKIILQYNGIKFIRANNKYAKEKIENYLKYGKVYNINNLSELNDFTIINEIINKMMSLLNSDDINKLKDIGFHLSKYNEYIKLFNEAFEKAKRESILEFSLISQIIMEREDLETFEEEKNKCPNRIDKILFHGTQILPISCILTNHFMKREKSHYYLGKGVYFTDSLDYCWFYRGFKKRRGSISRIPPTGEKFSFVASSIYYDQKGFKKVNDYKYTPKKMK